MTAREVVLEGGPPWGFRMHGGADVRQPLRISRVNPGSKAAHRGIREGDFISSINGQSTKELTNSEAHGLLKKAGESLKLGLNEDTIGSPKRRQYRTIHQETLQETVKKSSITTYSIQKTVETVESHPRKSNENTLSQINEHNTVNGNSKNNPTQNFAVARKSPHSSTSSTPTLVKEEILSTPSPDNAEASQRSSYTNCTISPSTNSSLSEDGNSSCSAPKLNEHLSIENSQVIMNDNVNTTSKSKRRRQRRKNRKLNENQSNGNDINPTNCDNSDNVVAESNRIEVKEDYRVDSPVEIVKKKPKINQNQIKSKSLDDDEMVKIQELSDVSESEEKLKDNQAIVSEASEGELDQEILKSEATPKTTLSSLSLTLEELHSDEMTLMSPEDEQKLRNFLQSINLVSGPEDATQQVFEKEKENLKFRKSQKRTALEQYFLPMCQNPRYLDAISEEASDRESDREQLNLKQHLKQGTPEAELNKPPVPPPRSNKNRKLFPQHFMAPVQQPPVLLVDTKILDNHSVTEGFCSTSTAAEATSSVEIVYLDSTESNSPAEIDNMSNDSHTLEPEKSSSNEEISKNEIKVNGICSSETETKGGSNENQDITEVVNKTEEMTNNTLLNIIGKTELNLNFRETNPIQRSNSKNINTSNTNAQLYKYEPTINDFTENMTVWKKDNVRQENKSCEMLKANETLTTSTYTNYSFVVKCNKPDIKPENCFLSQLTPPPTPENMSPKNGPTDLPGFIETNSRKTEELITNRENITEPIKDETDLIFNVIAHKNSADTVSTFNKTEANVTLESDKKKHHSSMLMDSKQYNVSEHKTCTTKGCPQENNLNQKINNNKFAGKTAVLTKEENLKKEDGIIYTNVISPPPPSRSPSISSNSSVDSSLCTAKYNPLNSSIADVTSIARDEEMNKPIPQFQPRSLREICLNFLLNLPFGADVLQELAEVSKSIESYTNNLPKSVLPKLIPNLPAFVNKSEADPNNDSCKLSVKAMPKMKEWVGIPTEKNPKLLMCISPKQKEELEKSEPVADEAGKLLDLHEKFVNRMQQEELRKETEEKVTITSISQSSSNVSVTSPTGNRLLEIIREEPSTTDDHYLYFVEKDPVNVNRRVENAESARLKAKNLSEWLNLARNKSMSESNLSSAPDIPENNLRKDFNTQPTPRRRTSLPYELFERQMIYLQEKERDIQRQLEQLEEEKRRLNSEMAPSRQFQAEDYHFSRKGDFAENRNTGPRPTSMPVMPTEFFRQQMYQEYMDKFAEREDRKQHKVIKVTSSKDMNENNSKNNECIPNKEIVHPIHIEKEFLDRVKQKQEEGKLGKNRDSVGREGTVEKEKEDEPVLVMDGDKLKDANQLPKHLQEFISITKQVAAGTDGIWAPGQRQDTCSREHRINETHKIVCDEAIPPVWTPKSANSSPTAERKEFRPVNFQSPVLGRKARTKSETLGSDSPSSAPPWKGPDYSSDTGIASSFEKRLPTSHSSPASGFGDFSTSPRLPKAQNPTITLLQKAREGQLPRGAAYIEVESKQYRPRNERPPIATPGDILYQIKNEYTSESDSERPRKMADLGPRKFEGIGPVSKDGMPLILRSEIKDQNQSKWYKRMYDTIHKQKPHNDEYVTIRYKQRRAQYPYTSGYLSEPEPGAYDSDFTDYKYLTMDRRRPLTQEKYSDAYTTSSTMPRSLSNKASSSDLLRNIQEPYKVQPGRIENYTPGHSSISEKEAKEWWDEVMDIFDGHLEQQKRVPPAQPRSFINQALKESGYESDSTLIFRRREEAAQELGPKEQKEAYKVIQKGGDVPLHGLRKPAPERPKEKELVEFFPISPTLTRIRIHKNVKPQKEIICCPVSVHYSNRHTFSAYKRTAPSSAALSKIPTPPPAPIPSPPRRKSSRNNPTLRLVSTMKLKTEKSPICNRHETCFTSTSNVNRTKVNYLRDKITCKLSPNTRRSESPRIRVLKKITTTPELKNRITSTISTSKDPKTLARRVQSKTNIHSCIGRSKSTDSVRIPPKSYTMPKKNSMNTSDESLNLKRASTRTFGTEKRKLDLRLSEKCNKLNKSPDLQSPTEVKKVVLSQSKSTSPATTYKRTNAVLCSTRTSKVKEVLPIKVGISEKARGVLRSSLQRPTSTSPTLTKRASPSPSVSSEKSKLVKTSLESLTSPRTTRKCKGSLKCKLDVSDKKNLKSKKEQINDEIASKSRTKKTADQSKKCFGKAEGTEIVKRLRHFNDENEKLSLLTLSDIEKQKQVMESNQFFRHLFLRDLSPTPSSSSKNNWLIEKTNQLGRRKSSFCEPSIGAMKVYLKHTRPVTDSKFISLDMERMRSRSASPKSVTFEETRPQIIAKRSSSLPPKLIFSQTSRPVSPMVYHRNMVSPPPSPKLSRSPSCRRIMHFKHLENLSKSNSYTKIPEYNLYMCSSLNQSTTSIDSLKSEDYQKYFHELVHSTKKCDKFKDLNEFYSGIEKLSELERTFCSKPRKRGESEIIDFDRWKEVRTRERAEQELNTLYNQIKENEKEKGFLYLPKDFRKYKWRREYDRGLRIKEKSVVNIKEKFERIKFEESERENARRKELALLKDVYKPLWRGSSVVNLANNMVERRSQSEGRVKTARQKLLDSERLLTRGIGSRIWSSLSMEQVNILKEQLAEIYNHHTIKEKPNYSIQVPRDNKPKYISNLTVRRNSDSSERVIKSKIEKNEVTENHKKMILHTLSKELLEKVAMKRKESKTALPIVVGKEILGAVAAADANLKSLHPAKPLIKTDATNTDNNKVLSTSENDSGSTDESSKTVIYVGNKEDIKKKVEYFEKVKDSDSYTPTIYKPAESTYDMGDVSLFSPKRQEESKDEKPKIFQSKSCQNMKEYFGEKELVKFATIPLSASRKQKFSPKKPELRALEISPLRSDSSESLRSRSISPYLKESQTVVEAGQVSRLKSKFEYIEDFYGNRFLRRSRSESDLHKVYLYPNIGYVDSMKRKYEYPAYSGRGRSRTRRGGVVSPIFLRAEDRFMPHINIISKIASLYSNKHQKNIKETQKSVEELAEILGCPVGEVEKLRDRFDVSQDDLSMIDRMYTSSPSIRELKDVSPYLTANWIAHRYPKFEDNTRSLSSPENSLASRDTSLVKKSARPKSSSPSPNPKKSLSILKPMQHQRQKVDYDRHQKYDPKIHEPVSRYQPSDSSRYRSGWSAHLKPSVSFKDPEPPIPPPKGHHARNFDQESPRKYVENEVTIHYKTPIRQEVKEYLSEDELAYRQAEAMKKIYQEERRKKYLQVSKSLQELQDMNSRRHTDNFIPSQKSPISLNRYDDFDDLAPTVKPRPRSPEPRLIARALYNFVGQTSRELTFRKGDLIYVRRQVDKNWYEGELNAMVGLFPTNYVEIVPYDGMKTTPRKSHEGQARAKYNFVAQTHLELSLAKGELVVITRRVDDNWFEGKIGGRKGIFPASYVEILIDPQEPPPPSSKPVAAPAAHSLLLNGSAGGKESMGSHCYTPSLPNQLTPSYHAKPVQVTSSGSYGSLGRSIKNPLNQALHIDTQSEPIPYRALYKYNPQNDDELELLEGDTVYVLEKCDDGWYVGSSDRTGAFGTFPGNYVEKI